MSLSNFLKSFSNGFSKKTIEEDMGVLFEDLLAYTKPRYELVNKDFGKKEFKSDWYKNFFTRYKNSVGRINDKNHIPVVLRVIDKIEERLKYLEVAVDDHFNENISQDAMNFKRLNILAYLEACTFFCVYSRRLLNTTMQIEINKLSEDVKNELEDVIPFNLEWLKIRRDTYFEITRILLESSGDLEKIIEELPDVNVNSLNIKSVESINPGYDPKGFGFIPVVLNPAYHIGLLAAEWQASRLRSAEAERDILEVQLLNLKLLKDGKNDANIQRQISYMETNRLTPLYKKIAKMEKDYG